MFTKNLSLAFSASLIALLAPAGRAATAAKADNEPVVFLVAYSVRDLPVWRVDSAGKPRFDAAILISHIRSSVEPASWKNPEAIIGQSPENAALIVAQTDDVHDKIRQFIDRQQAFADHDVAQRLKDNLDVAATARQRVLLFVSGANSESTDEFFAARFGEHASAEIEPALDNYVVHCLTPALARELPELTVSLPAGDGATLAVLDSGGSLVAEADFNRFRLQAAVGAALDPALLADFLTEHAEQLPNARATLQAALTQAAQEDKRVLVQMSGPHCGPCITLSRYLASQHKLLARDYVHVKLDRRMTSSDEITAELVDGLNLVPWMAILSGDGDVLTTSMSDEGNIAFPRSEVARQHFKRMLETTARRLTAGEIQSLVEAVNER